MRKIHLLLLLLFVASPLHAAEYPEPTSADYVIRDFRFASGETLPELRIHYRTLGTPRRGEDGKVSNAVLILHGTTGSGANFLRPEFAGELFGEGQPLDATRYYLILPDGIGHGGSSKPSDGLHARFPRYGYRDMIEAQHRLLTEGLKVDHLRLVMGTSMGGMHTWLWGETHPEFMDALLPLASLPTQISGRNRVWRRVIIDAIRNDPAWEHGEYRDQPPSLRTAAEMLFFMSNNPVERQKEAPTREAADRVLDDYVARTMQDDGRQRRALRDREFGGLRPRPGPGADQGTAAGDQLRGRPDQPARAGHPGAGDPAREAGQGDRHPPERPDPGARHPHARRRLEGAPDRAAGRDGAVNGQG